MKRPPLLRSIREPRLRMKLAKSHFDYVEKAMVGVHQTIHQQHGWPSPQLEAVNRVSGYVFSMLRLDRNNLKG